MIIHLHFSIGAHWAKKMVTWMGLLEEGTPCGSDSRVDSALISQAELKEIDGIFVGII